MPKQRTALKRQATAFRASPLRAVPGSRLPETKHDKFKRIGVPRVERAMLGIRLIANLANPILYEYTDREVSEIVSTLEREIADLKLRFQKGRKFERPTFELPAA